jgi:hypothetical protein
MKERAALPRLSTFGEVLQVSQQRFLAFHLFGVNTV